MAQSRLNAAVESTIHQNRALVEVLAHNLQRSREEAVRLARMRFQAGAGTSLELVTAQASYSNAQHTLADSRYSQIAARAQLNLSLGN